MSHVTCDWLCLGGQAPGCRQLTCLFLSPACSQPLVYPGIASISHYSLIIQPYLNKFCIFQSLSKYVLTIFCQFRNPELRGSQDFILIVSRMVSGFQAQFEAEWVACTRSHFWPSPMCFLHGLSPLGGESLKPQQAKRRVNTGPMCSGSLKRSVLCGVTLN